MDNRGKESHVYGMLKDGVFSGFCSLCGARIPKYRDDYHGKKICANCHAELVPWDGKGGKNVYLTEIFKGANCDEKAGNNMG